MGIRVTNCVGFRLSGLHVSKCWGDGIYLDQTGISDTLNTEPVDTEVFSCRSFDNRRNNLSVIHADNYRIHDNEFINANGTAPEAGIDVEPDSALWVCREGQIYNNVCKDNNGGGIGIIDTSAGTLEDCLVTDNICRNNGTVTNARGGIYIVGIDGDTVVQLKGNRCISNYGAGITVNGNNQGAPTAPGRVSIIGGECATSITGTRSGGAITAGHGVHMTDDIGNFIVSGVSVHHNARHGIFCDQASVQQGVITGNLVFSNSQDTDVTYDNIHLDSSTSGIEVDSNMVIKEAVGEGLTNLPAYGINCQSLNPNIICNNTVLTGGDTGNMNVPGAVMIPDDATRNVVVKDNLGYANETAARSATFGVGTTGTGTVTIAHGLDTQNIDGTSHLDKIAGQMQITVCYELGADGNTTVTGSPIVVANIIDVDATNVTVRYDVLTAATTGNCRVNLMVLSPIV
jgi:hypothetical protein